MRVSTILQAGFLAAAITAAPLAYSPQNGVGPASGCAQTIKNPGTGTCCPDDDSICVTPTGNINGHFYKPEGRCW